jgi:hypothetical protein
MPHRDLTDGRIRVIHPNAYDVAAPTARKRRQRVAGEATRRTELLNLCCRLSKNSLSSSSLGTAPSTGTGRTSTDLRGDDGTRASSCASPPAGDRAEYRVTRQDNQHAVTNGRMHSGVLLAWILCARLGEHPRKGAVWYAISSWCRRRASFD